MSSDNFIAIVKENKKYIGYNCSASQSYSKISDYKKCFREFECASVKKAIKKAQEVWPCEYGYRFVNL